MIAAGEGDVDESLLTGEPKPATHREGDAVKAGTINLDGSFEVIATAVGDSTTARSDRTPASRGVVGALSARTDGG
ncbi:MAG: hypothetical protein U0V48_11740 [Anaerolineales bacterium]